MVLLGGGVWKSLGVVELLAPGVCVVLWWRWWQSLGAGVDWLGGAEQVGG